MTTQMSTHLPASLHIPVSRPRKHEEASLLECYAASLGAAVTSVSEDHSAFILMVGSPEESAPIYPMTKHIIPHNLHLWQHCCEKLKP